MRYFKKIIECYTNPNWFTFTFLVLIYSFFAKKRIIILSLTNNLDNNVWDISFAILCDPFFIIYFILPIWITISIRIINNIWSEINLIRLSSYKNWLKHSLAEALLCLIILQGLLILITYIVSFDFSFNFEWSEFSSVNLVTDTFSYYLSNSNLNPFFSLIIQMIYLFLFLMAIHSILSVFFLFVQKNLITYSFGLVIWVGIIVLFKVFMNNNWLNISKYISLPYFFSSFDSWMYPILVYTILIALILLLGKLKK